jgi:DNA-binding NarL/FixJ family response regulator
MNPSGDGVPDRPLKVLVVEDDAAFRRLFCSALERAQGMELLAAVETGRAALERLQVERPDVLMVDLGLPDVSGLEVIRQCAELHPTCEIMVVTVFGDEQHIIKSIEAGATGYLQKDALPDDLVAQIRTLHAGGSPISPVIARQLLRRHWVAPSGASAGETGRHQTATVATESLSERERNVLQLVAKGYTFAEIARLLNISPHSVMTYVKRTYRKLQVNSKTEAVYEARKMGLLRD